MQDIINMYIAEAALMALVCLLIGWRKDYSRILCGIAGLIAGPLAVIILAILPNRRITEETPASRQTIRTEEPRPVPQPAPTPQPAPSEPEPDQKPITEIRNGEAFLLYGRPVMMVKNGFDPKEGSVPSPTSYDICLIADFKNGPPTQIGFRSGQKYTVLDIPMTVVRMKAFHAEDGVWEFADANGHEISFRPYIWADMILHSANHETEILLAEYEKKMYVADIKCADPWGRNYLAFRYSTMQKELILIDNEIYCNESAPINLGAHKYLNRFVGWQNEKECRMVLDQLEQLPACKPSEVTWEYLYRNGGVCCFMDPETYEQYEIEIYRMCRLPGEGDESKICKLTIAFDRVIQMNIIA